MKIVPITIATSILLSSVSTSAASLKRTEAQTLITNVALSPAEAFKLGENKLAQLRSGSPLMLGTELKIHSGSADLSTLHLNDGAYITVQERMNSNGQLGYVGLLNIDYSYIEIDDDD